MNGKNLEENLEKAIALDEKYARENAAKIRAVEQRVNSYDEFKELVLGCHLQPLAKKESIISPCQNALWNQGARGSCAAASDRVEFEISKFLPNQKGHK